MSAAIERIHGLLSQRGLSYQDPQARLFAQSIDGVTEAQLEEYFGHGPLRDLMLDGQVTEILVNGHRDIRYEKSGKIHEWNFSFSSEESLRRYVRRLLSPRGRKVDQSVPFADAALEDGVRIHVAAPPVSRMGLYLSIRKPSRDPWTLGRLEASGTFSAEARARLAELVARKKNIFVSGGTGSGKTSLLSALIGEVDVRERVIALEDVSELRPVHPHFLSLEARGANQEGEGELPLSRLLRESLRMRPDRLIIGECRGPEALDLLMALHSGHPGSMGTIHSSGPRDALGRLETLALLAAGNLGEMGVKNLIASGIHAVVHLERANGQRKVRSMAELKGLDGGNYLLKETLF